MSYKFYPGKMYRMPTHFGPSLGPRQGKDGEKFPCKDSPKTIEYSVSFLTDRKQLEELVPERFEVAGEPVATVFFRCKKEIEWLAGRGYNALGLTFRAAFNGEKDRAVGPFLTVLWENFPDAIITGRDELGFSKIYCELPEPVVFRGETHCMANWQGFHFMDLKLMNMTAVAPKDFSLPEKDPCPDDVLSGIMHYKYIPKTGVWGEADANYAVLTPDKTNLIIKKMWRGEGTVEFYKARWEDMPTQYTITNAFYGLEIKEYRGAAIVHSIGGKDLSDQRILR